MSLWHRAAENVSFLQASGSFPGGSDGKESTCNMETWVQSLGWEDPLEKEMATHTSIPAWRIPMDRGAWRATVHGVAKSRTQLKLLNTAPHIGIWLPRWEEETESQRAAHQSHRLAPLLQGEWGGGRSEGGVISPEAD